MDKDMNRARSRPLLQALAAGVAAGALSGLPYASCLCCLWIIGGGILAGFLLVRSSPQPPPPGEAARMGALSGIAAAAVVSLLSIPLAPMNMAFARRFMERMADYVPEMPAGWDQWLAQGGSSPFSLPWFLAGFALNAAVFAALAALGGTIGVNLFVRRPGADPSSPPGPGSPS
jgi:hypothetical protein